MPKPVRHERYVSVDLSYLLDNPDNQALRGSNKQWWITVYDDGSTLVQFGKNTEGGLTGHSEKQHGAVDAAMAFADKKIREKMTPETDKKTGMVTQYTKVNVVETKEGDRSRSVSASVSDLADIARKQIAQGDPIVAELVARLARENVHNIVAATGGKMNYDDTTGLFNTPMGVITQEKVDEGRALLATVIQFVKKRQYSDQRYIDATQSYLRVVPTDLGYGRTTLDMIFPDIAAVTAQGDILDALEASLKMVTDRALAAAQGKDVSQMQVEVPKVFEVTLSLIEAEKDIDKLRKMYRDTQKNEHRLEHLDVRRVFTLDIRSMKDAFEAKGVAIGQRRTLWHGTRVANLISIFRGGLIVPPRNCYGYSGRMYGDGLYFAPNSSKSLQYARGSGDRSYMLLVDVAMGKSYTPSGSISSIPAGYDSIWARAGRSGVINDEVIVPNTYQANPIYLLEFSTGGR